MKKHEKVTKSKLGVFLMYLFIMGTVLFCLQMSNSPYKSEDMMNSGKQRAIIGNDD